jgi:hypothetical protein
MLIKSLSIVMAELRSIFGQLLAAQWHKIGTHPTVKFRQTAPEHDNGYK